MFSLMRDEVVKLHVDEGILESTMRKLDVPTGALGIILFERYISSGLSKNQQIVNRP